MGTTQQQKTQNQEVEATPTRIDALDNDPVKTTNETNAATPTQSTLLTGQLGNAYDEMKRNSPTLGKLDGWKARIAKVVNPVAFMTSADESGNRAKGNYDIGVTNKNAAEGFYELAKGECRAIAGEIKSALGDTSLTSLERIHLEQMSLFLEGYATIYETLQSTGKSSSASKRQQMTDNVNGVIMDVRASRLALDPTLFGDRFAVIDSSLNDISIFVNSWSTVAASSDVTSASPVMWASFLKTVERYRMILNNYDKLEAAGGDATGTSKMSMRHGAKTAEQADQVAMENGGYMAMALKTYGFYASDAAKMVEQIKDISKKVQSGEYKTEEECIAAFRAGIGGGKASELFYKKIDKVAKAQWKAYLADINTNLANKSTEMANSDISSGNTHAEVAEENIDSRNVNMRNRDENLAFFGMNTKEITDIGKDESIPVIQPSAKAHIILVDEWNTNGPGSAYKQYHDDRAEYSALAAEGKVAIRDNTDVYLPPPDLSMQYDYELLGRGKLTNQEIGYVDLKQEDVDAAETAAWGFHEQAKANLDEAKAYSGSANAHLGDAVTYLFKAQNYLTEAKYAANFIASDHPALVAGLHETQKQINAVESKIGITKEQIAQVRTYQSQLDARLANVVSSIDNYDPAKLKVPLPSATVGGQELESEHYQKLSLSLSGPLAGSVLKWVGGVSGEYAQTVSSNAIEDVWHKARIEAYAGVEADLWLAKAGIKLIGFFEAQVKNAEGLLDTIDKGASELGRWAYAWWYELDGMGSRVSIPMRAAKQQANELYDNLKGISDADIAAWQARLEKSKTSMNDIHRTLSTRLLTAVSNRAKLPGDVGQEMADAMLDLTEIEAGLDAMREAPNDEREGAVDREKAGFGQTANSAMDDAQARIADVDPGTNDPNVKFEAGVGIEGYAKLGTSTSKMSMSVSGRRVYSMSDGDGDEFNYDVSSKTIYKVGISVGEFSGEITYMPLKDGNSFALAMSIPFAGGDGLDGSTVLQAMAGDLKTIRSKSAKEWIQTAKEKIAAREKDFKMPKGEATARGKVEIGGKVTLNDDWSFNSGEVSFGIAVEMGAGTSFAKVSYEQGNKVTFKF